jgi:AraC-like DNA-binding protein
MMANSAPLRRFSAVDTVRPDEAREQIGRIFCPHRLIPRGSQAEHFHARHRTVRQAGYSVNFVAYGAEVDIDPGELGGFFLLQIPLTGTATVACGTSAAAAEAGRMASLLSPTLPTRMRWARGTEKLIIQIDRGPLEALLAAVTDGAAQRIEFAAPVSLETPTGRAVRAHAELMLAAAEAEAPLPEAYLGHLRDGLSTLLLKSLDHSAAACFAAPAALPAPRAVKRAEAFIAAAIDRPIAIAEVVAHAGVSLRSLQEGFRRYRGTTLSRHIQAMRLERFHAGLFHAAPKASVTDIAFAAGIGHLGRAAAAYRRRYGELPSETLRRSGPA